LSDLNNDKKYEINDLLDSDEVKHCFLYCNHLGQKTNTRCCISYCCDKSQKFSEKWRIKRMVKCNVFLSWLPLVYKESFLEENKPKKKKRQESKPRKRVTNRKKKK
jgi:hypothetical protein